MKVNAKIMQKLIGIMLVIFPLIPILLYKDGTALVLLAPIGLYAIFTKEIL